MNLKNLNLLFENKDPKIEIKIKDLIKKFNNCYIKFIIVLIILITIIMFNKKHGMNYRGSLRLRNMKKSFLMIKMNKKRINQSHYQMNFKRFATKT